jgi:hypothetical protein
MKIREIPADLRAQMRESVEKGARRLDHRHPRWFKKIDTKSLDLSKACQCVIGQLYGDYDEHFLRRIINNLSGRADLFLAAGGYGFTTPEDVDTWVSSPSAELYAAGVDYYDDEFQAALEVVRYRRDLAWQALDHYWKLQIRDRRGMAASS